MKLINANIERVRQINSVEQQLTLAVDSDLRGIKPGQVMLARLVEGDADIQRWDPYLRETWWPVGVNGRGQLIVQRPLRITYHPQQPVSLLGPVGRPYAFRRALQNVLLIAYDTAPTPLTIMLDQLLHHKISATLVLLGTARTIDTAHLPPEVEVIRGEDGLRWPDMDMTLNWADQAFIVVRPDDELAHFAGALRTLRESRVEVPEQYLYGVFQSMLPCGVGACSACIVRTRSGLKTVCVDGPAFDLTRLTLPG